VHSSSGKRSGRLFEAKCEYMVALGGGYIDKQGSVCLCLEYMDGGSLQDAMDLGVKLEEEQVANVAFCTLKVSSECSVLYPEVSGGSSGSSSRVSSARFTHALHTPSTRTPSRR
jgi:hypothetical protein